MRKIGNLAVTTLYFQHGAAGSGDWYALTPDGQVQVQNLDNPGFESFDIHAIGGVAFYTPLSGDYGRDETAGHDTAKQVLGDEKLKAIAHELTKTVKENMSIDWHKRKNAQARMRVAVRKLLKKYGYPPDLQKMAVENVVEQAELMASNI